jgi:hypothetical protein
MIEHDSKRRERDWTARTYLSISNNTADEMLTQTAMRRRNIVLGRIRQPKEQVGLAWAQHQTAEPEERTANAPSDDWLSLPS